MSQNETKRTVLIIDDERGIREVLAEILADSFDKIYEAPDGSSGLKIIQSEKPQVIISDYHMPNLNGLELLRILKEQRVETPVIWITGHASRELFREAWVSGVYDFFEKPFQSKDLKECTVNAVDWGKNFNAHRVPNYITRMKSQEINLALDKKNYDAVLETCKSKGMSISSYVNALIEEELKKSA